MAAGAGLTRAGLTRAGLTRAGLTRASLAAYAGPALPLAALTLPLYVILPTFYAESVGLPLALVGTILLAVRLADAVSDPLIGLLADRYRPPLGRRRGWFLAACLPAALAAYMILTPPEGAGGTYLLFWGLALSLGYTASIIPYTAWGAELSDDYHGRSRIAGAREGMVLVGTLIAVSVPAIAEALGAPGQATALKVLALIVAVALPGLTLVAVWRLPEPRDTGAALPPLADGFRQVARNRPFVRLLAAFVLNGFANGLPATLFLFFVARALAAPDMQGPFLFLYFLCGVAGVPLWLAVSRRIGKHRTWCVAMLGACAVFALVPLLGPGDLAGFAVICVLTGLALGADLALPSAIQADVIDVDRMATGTRRSGLYFALWGLATKLSLALAVGLAFPLLGLAGFDPAAADTVGIGALVALYAIVPVVLKLAAIALMWNFPLGAKEHAELAARLARQTG